MTTFHRSGRMLLLFGAVSAAVILAGMPGPAARAAQSAREGPRAPEFPAGLKWWNSPPLTVSGLKGKVLLVDFWEYTCVNCIRTLPYLKAWHERYAGKGLVIVGVHAPEFAFAKEEANVARAVKQFDLKYPVVNDRDYQVWNLYSNRYWPAKYLFDAKGVLRYNHFGEGSYGDIEQQIQKLLREAKPSVSLPKIMEPVRGEDRPGAVCYPVTPELYVGYQRGQIGNPEGYRPDRAVTFKDPGAYQDGLIYAHGAWNNEAESLRHARTTPAAEDYVAIRYHALEVNSVMKPEGGKPLTVIVTQNGAPVRPGDKGTDIRYDGQGRSYVLVNEPRMYQLIRNGAFGTYDLKLACAGEGLGVYSFTFVSCETAPRETLR
jgi:thiol-disulfide isomerase/thioredoxin